MLLELIIEVDLANLSVQKMYAVDTLMRKCRNEAEAELERRIHEKATPLIEICKRFTIATEQTLTLNICK